MKKTLLCIAICAYSSLSFAQNEIVKTIAGTGTGGYTGDGGAATAAQIATVSTNGIATDNAGNTYFVDCMNHVVRKISSTGIITTIAGTGVMGFSGDGGPAISATLSSPGDIAIDNTGNIYISDGNNFRIRKINTSGIITTFAGDGTPFYTGDGGAATAAAMRPARVNVDNAGNVYVVDGVHAVVRKINPAGIISTLVGTGVAGFSGDGGPSTAAQIAGPGGVAADAAGNIYIADGANYRIRKINTSGIITTIAGTGTSGFSGDGGSAMLAQFTGIHDLAIDVFGNLYLADRDNYRIRKITPSGIISTVTGIGTAGCSSVNNAPAISSPTNWPISVCTDPAGRLYFTDNYCQRLRMASKPADVVSDSFSVYITSLCAGPSMAVVANPLSTGLSIRTSFGDGTTSVTPITSGYATLTHTYPYPGNYTIKYVLYNGATPIDTAIYTYEYTFCSTFPVTFYHDVNSNCKKDGTPEPFITVPILTAVDSNGIRIDTFSASSGSYYNAYGVPGDVYTFNVISYPTGMQFSCPGAGTFSGTLTSSIYSNPELSVGFSCNSLTSFDLGEYSGARTGRHYQEGIILVDNDFCTPTDATVTLNFSPSFIFDGSVPPPTSVSGHTATWLLHGVATYNSNQVSIRYGLSTPSTWLMPGDTVMSHIVVNPTTGDVDPSNNNETRVDTVKSSFDPNQITVVPAGTIVSGTQLKYTIDFENMGNDTAHNIYVMDTLSDNVVASSLRFVAASAFMKISQYKWSGHNIVRFDFPGIKLLDSSYHHLCHGSLIFTINTKTGLPSGTTISNQAGIYFDDNPVVMTNTVVDMIGFPTGIAHTGGNGAVQLYPNPTDDVLGIQMENGAYSSYTITNGIGQVMMHQSINNANTNVNVRALAPGLYYITLKGEQGTITRKFIKQ